MDAIDKATRGEAAKRLMEDELLQECLGTLETHALYRLRSADINDTKTLQTLALSLQAISGFRRQLELVMRDGIEAVKTEEHLATLSPFRRKLAGLI